MRSYVTGVGTNTLSSTRQRHLRSANSYVGSD